MDRNHPSSAELMEYAEALEHPHRRVSAAVAAHVAECARCQSEAAEVSATLKLLGQAGTIEPSKDLSGRLLMRVTKHARVVQARRVRFRVFKQTARVTAYAAAFVIAVTVTVYGSVGPGFAKSDLSDGSVVSSGPEESDRVGSPVRGNGVFVRAAFEASPQQELLSAVVFSYPSRPQTLREAQLLRKARAIDAEISQALEALADNPACVRASDLVNANRQRLTETLKNLYVERSL